METARKLRCKNKNCGYTDDAIKFGMDPEDKSFRWCPKCYAYGPDIVAVGESADLCGACRQQPPMPNEKTCFACAGDTILVRAQSQDGEERFLSELGEV